MEKVPVLVLAVGSSSEGRWPYIPGDSWSWPYGCSWAIGRSDSRRNVNSG